MTKGILITWAVGTVVLLALLFRLLFQVSEASVQTMANAAASLAKPADVAAAVVVSGPVVATAQKKPDGTVTTTTHYVPPEGSVQVVVKKDGTATVTVKDKGFCLSPGLYGGAAVGAGARFVAGAGCKLVYWGRFGLDAGVVGRPFAAFAAVSYTPPWRFRNTAIFAGVTTGNRAIAGLVIRF
jgi:hypothetical protein